jgi:hypothetical protein
VTPLSAGSRHGEFTDDRVVHRCLCGWTGRWDEAFAHIVATLGDAGHAIEDEG